MNNEIKPYRERMAMYYGTTGEALEGLKTCADAEIAELRAKVESLAADAEQFRGEGWLCAMDAITTRLPSTYYMDPPDGGSVTVLEQLERMAKDAARYRWLTENKYVPWGAFLNDIQAASEGLDATIDAAIEEEKA